MRLLVDSDAFCKLGVSGLLPDALGVFGVDFEECGRLPALPHMLRRGSLPRTYGVEACKRLIPTAEDMPVVEDAPESWLDKLALLPAVDPGEAILFAAAANARIPAISGDVRALRSLKEVPEFSDAVSGRVIILEAILLVLCQRLGSDLMRERIKPIRAIDAVARVCFSAENPSPEDGLRSYFRDRMRELAPMILWAPEEDV